MVAALVECGFQEAQIEVQDEATALYGYQSDVRPQQAHLIIRRNHIGFGANDVGWERQPNGAYRAWISEFDAGVGPFNHRQATARFNQTMQNKIRQEYAFQVIHRQQRKREGAR